MVIFHLLMFLLIAFGMLLEALKLNSNRCIGADVVQPQGDEPDLRP